MKPQPRAWPVWLALALFMVPGLIGLGMLGGAKDSAANRVEFSQDAVGRSVVVGGTLSDIETNPGLPTATAFYTAEIPDAQGGSAETVTLAGDEHWGFPPSSDYPTDLEFLVVLDDPPRGVAHGAVGSLHALDESDVAKAEGGLALARGLWVAGIVGFWAVVLGLAAIAVVLGVRRRGAAQIARSTAPGGPPLL